MALIWVLYYLIFIQQFLGTIIITILCADSADDKMVIFFLFFQENRFWHFMQIVSIGDNLHGMSKPVFWKKKRKEKEKYFCVSSAENFTQSAKH